MIINLLFLKIMEQNVFSMPKIGEKAPEFKNAFNRLLFS